jgi:hypothetical protein
MSRWSVDEPLVGKLEKEGWNKKQEEMAEYAHMAALVQDYT